MKTFVTLLFVIIWFIHLILGVGAGYAALRLWYGRRHPLIKWVGLYMNAFIVDVLSAVVLLFVAKGVVFTWKFATVMFVSTFICDVIRAPLILYLIRGPSPLPPTGPVVNQLDEIRRIVRDEIAAASGTTTVTVKGPSATTPEPSVMSKEK